MAKTTKTVEMTKDEMLTKIAELEAKLANVKSGGKNRKGDVLRLLNEGYDSIESIAEVLDIIKKNVSSILSALRKQGHVIINIRAGGNSILQLVNEEDAAKLFNK